MNQIHEAKRSREPGPVRQHLFQTGIERTDTAVAWALPPREWRMLEKRTQFRFRKSRTTRNFSCCTHTYPLRGMIPGRNRFSRLLRPWFSRNGNSDRGWLEANPVRAQL